MLGFCALAPLGDAIAKILSGTIPLGQIVLIRFAFQAILLWPLVRRSGQPIRLTRRQFWLLLWRTLLHISGIWVMILALRHLPLADAIAIAYVMPFIMLLLGRFVLHEAVGARRLAACLVGFTGTMMVMQPSFLAVGWAATLPLGVAVIFALFMLVTRQIAREIDPVAMQAINGVMGTVLLFPLVALAEGSGLAEFDPVEPGMAEIGLLVALGLLGTLAHLLMTWSLRFAPASTLAPMQYLEIPFAALFGWLIFSEFPDGMAFIGIVVVMAAGLYIINRERRQRAVPVPKSPAGVPPSAG
ncbi:EamA domain-containing membrane protein RarD [Aliiruegeria haliotis]|uniref:EamA domain-containing membrane protein RarD n=2 Tax=Aliiruegeria haliotis TaxID=1280846 RepID=A0A2T0RRJ1_9RHOB|nr:EamA domain-containing membrane protein RarD [Aliiruegeria haliotis]